MGRSHLNCFAVATRIPLASGYGICVSVWLWKGVTEFRESRRGPGRESHPESHRGGGHWGHCQGLLPWKGSTKFLQQRALNNSSQEEPWVFLLAVTTQEGQGLKSHKVALGGWQGGLRFRS